MFELLTKHIYTQTILDYFIIYAEVDIMEIKFYRCNICGNIVGMVFDSGAVPACCGQDMEELIPNTVEASKEKHIPVVKVIGNKAEVNVGSVDHPMLPEHRIDWIYIRTNLGGQRKDLAVGGKPHATFALLEGEKVLEAYEYCSIHGLWKVVL